MELARKLQPLACSLVEEEFCGTDKGELREAGHVFSAHFAARDALEAGTGLETLAEAANVMQSCTLPVDRRESAIASHLQLNENLYPVPSTRTLDGTTAAVYSQPHADLSPRPMVPQYNSTHFSDVHHYDEQAIAVLGGINGGPWTNEYLSVGSGELAESRSAPSGLQASSYSTTNVHVASNDLPNWRPSDQTQDLWQGTDVGPEQLAAWDAYWSTLWQPQQYDSIVA